jgi:hypothetical protein
MSVSVKKKNINMMNLQVFLDSAPMHLSFSSTRIHISSMRRTCSSSYSFKSGAMVIEDKIINNLGEKRGTVKKKN